MPKFSMLLEFTKLGRDGCPAVPRGGKPSERCWQDYLKGAADTNLVFVLAKQNADMIALYSYEAQALF